MSDDVGPFAGWADLDPTGTMPRLVPLLRRVPGATMLERSVVAPVERTVVTALARRLVAVAAAPDIQARIESRLKPPDQLPAATTFQRMLDTSGTLTTDEQHERMLRALVAQVVPGEARILAALAEGPAAVVHVVAPALPGTPGLSILENVTNIGQRAGIKQKDQVPHHIVRLKNLGLVDDGDEAPHLATEYEILLASRAVREARHTTSRPLPPKVRRASLRLTPLGRELVTGCLALRDDA